MVQTFLTHPQVRWKVKEEFEKGAVNRGEFMVVKAVKPQETLFWVLSVEEKGAWVWSHEVAQKYSSWISFYGVK